MINAIAHKFFKYFIVLCISFIILFAVLISVIRIVLPRITHHTYLQRVTSRLLDSPVRISAVSTDWDGLQPRIHLDKLEILDAHSHKPQLMISHMVLQINLLSSLLHWQLLPSRVTVDGADISIYRDTHGKLIIIGLSQKQVNQNHATKLKSVIIWLLTQSDITLSKIHINYLQHAQIYNINVRIRNHFYEHQFRGSFDIGSNAQSHFQAIGILFGRGSALNYLSGRMYVSASNFSNQTLRALNKSIPLLSSYSARKLNGSFKSWIGLSRGRLTSVLVDYAIRQFQYGTYTLSNALGRIEWDKQSQRNILQLNNVLGSVYLSKWFDHPIRIGALQLDANLYHDTSGFHLAIPKLVLNNGNININGQLKFFKAANKPVIVDSLLGIRIANLRSVASYVPTRLIKKHLNEWFKQAFLGGTLDHGVVVYRGPLRKDALLNHRGQLEVAAKLHHLDISYVPHWPLANNAEVNVSIHNKLLSATSNHIESLGNVIDHLTMQIPFKKNSVLTLALHANSDLYNGWNYVQHTPMHLAKILNRMHFSGPMDFNFSLHFPLHGKPHKDVIARGSIKTTKGSFSLPQWNVAFTHINGTVNFNNKALYDGGHALDAKIFGKPVQIHVKTIASPQDSIIEFDGRGKLSTRDIEQHFSLPFVQFFKGSSLFTAHLLLHDSKALGNELHIASDLVGVYSHNLPHPFAKNAAQNRMIHLDIAMHENAALLLRVQYAKLASAALTYTKTTDGLRFKSGDIMLGGQKARFLSKSGFVINGFMSILNWNEWQPFLSQLLTMQKSKHHKHIVPIESIDLHVGKLKVYGNVFNKIYLSLKPLEKAWSVQIANSAADGNIVIPMNRSDAWQLNFKRLYLGKMKNQSQIKINPAVLPPLQISIDDLKLSKTAYGDVQLVTLPDPSGLVIKTVQVKTPYYFLQAHGQWDQQKGHQRTKLVGTLNTSNLGNLLYAWGGKKLMSDGKGNATFNLNWDGSPLHIDWHHIVGSMQFNFKDGSLLNIGKNSEAKIGIGRLLNFLSVSSIFRMLELDFKDITHKGLLYDTFKGKWTFTGDKAVTHNTYFDGHVVKIYAQGELDLVNQRSNIWLYVMPQLTSSVPLIVGIVGGPVAGVAAWVANKLLGPEINRISASTYHVTGPWKQPKIAKLDTDKK